MPTAHLVNLPSYMHIQIAGSLLDPSIEATASFHPTLRRYVNSSFQVGFGSEAGWMSHGPEHWTKFIDQTIAATNQPVVVSDVRIPHEAEWVTDERPFGHRRETFRSRRCPHRHRTRTSSRCSRPRACLRASLVPALTHGDSAQRRVEGRALRRG